MSTTAPAHGDYFRTPAAQAEFQRRWNQYVEKLTPIRCRHFDGCTDPRCDCTCTGCQ